MIDYRKQLYDKYNSTFKQQFLNFSKEVIEAEWKTYEYKYLPLIKSYNKNSSILELGCGRGIMLEFLKDNGFKNTFGIDISEEQIKIALEKNLNVKKYDVFDFFRESKNTYDIIIALDFVEHFNKDEIILIFNLIFEHLNDGGIFIFHTPNGQAMLSNRLLFSDLTHLTIFTPYSAQQLLKYVGFNSISIYEKGPVPKNLKGIVRSILWWCIKIIYNFLYMIETGRTEKILTQNFIVAAKKS